MVEASATCRCQQVPGGADCPDLQTATFEVHRQTVARQVLKGYTPQEVPTRARSDTPRRGAVPFGLAVGVVDPGRLKVNI
jgi:hypothetical protein